MYKKVFLFLVLMAAPIAASAQLKVKSDGSVVAGTEMLVNSVLFPSLEVGHSGETFYCNVGIYGKADNLSNVGHAYGIYGVGSRGYNGCSYGVLGAIENSTGGAGIAGFTSPMVYLGMNGTYAGYFGGDTRVNGTLTATSVVQTSDIRLKENIVPFGRQSGSTLNKVKDMNVIEYSYKDVIPSMILPDSVSAKEVLAKMGIKSGKRHIGLIAQELQELYPTLVEEGQDGYLAINYIELVPVLVRAIQELKEELDAVKGDCNGKTRSAVSFNNEQIATTNKNVLYQNSPNPFKEQTVIRFKLADDVQNAAICIFDMTGKTVKELPISSGMESVSVGGYELGEGMFLYSLIVNGQEIDTKKMIISK